MKTPLRDQVTLVFLRDAPITDHMAPITDHMAPITDHMAPITDHLTPITEHLTPITEHLTPIRTHQTLIRRHLTAIRSVVPLHGSPASSFRQRQASPRPPDPTPTRPPAEPAEPAHTALWMLSAKNPPLPPPARKQSLTAAQLKPNRPRRGAAGPTEPIRSSARSADNKPTRRHRPIDSPGVI
jgi:hypothetical protein